MAFNPWRSLRGLPSGIWLLSAAMLINRAGTMALPFLVLYLTERLGLSAGEAALVVAFYGAGSLITSPLAGWLCDRIGAVRIMKLSLVLSGAMLLIFPLAKSFLSVSVITVIWAVLGEAFRPASLAVAADMVAPEQRKAGFALIRLAVNLGMSVGPAVGGFLAAVSFPALFLVDGATSILAGVVLAALWRQPAPSDALDPEPQHSASHADPGRGALADHRFLLFLAAFIPVQVVFFQLQAAMPLFLVRSPGISASGFGILLTINTVLIILLEVPLNSAMAHWNARKSLAAGALLVGIGFGSLAFATGVWSVAATVVVWTFGEMILFPGSSAYVADSAPPQRRGQYMGLFQMTFSLSFTIGPWLGAEVLEAFGAPFLWTAAFVGCLLSAALMARAATGRAAHLTHA